MLKVFYKHLKQKLIRLKQTHVCASYAQPLVGFAFFQWTLPKLCCLLSLWFRFAAVDIIFDFEIHALSSLSNTLGQVNCSLRCLSSSYAVAGLYAELFMFQIVHVFVWTWELEFSVIAFKRIGVKILELKKKY